MLTYLFSLFKIKYKNKLLLIEFSLLSINWVTNFWWELKNTLICLLQSDTENLHHNIRKLWKPQMKHKMHFLFLCDSE